MSRLPLPSSCSVGNYQYAAVFNIGQIDSLPVYASQVMAATRSDPVLSRVIKFTRSGWPDTVPEYLKPYWRKIAAEGDCLFWGTRVIVPEKLHSRVLEELHRGHPGIVRMKSLTRSHVWWPNLDSQVEAQAKSCTACQVNKNLPPKAPLHLWAWPTIPWQRIHITLLDL